MRQYAAFLVRKICFTFPLAVIFRMPEFGKTMHVKLVCMNPPEFIFARESISPGTGEWWDFATSMHKNEKQ
jgi:hypothetical protein